jgi:dCMP deaminase
LPLAVRPPLPNFSGKTEADRFFLDLAFGERLRSEDPKARLVPQSGVGAVIVGAEGILELSANILPPALKVHHDEHSRTISDEERYHFIEHAERAAIFKAFLAKRDLNGATIYCTRFPCSDCARAIVWAGIGRGVFAAGYAGEARWLQSQRAALHILRKAGVTVRVLNMPKE